MNPFLILFIIIFCYFLIGAIAGGIDAKRSKRPNTEDFFMIFWLWPFIIIILAFMVGIPTLVGYIFNIKWDREL